MAKLRLIELTQYYNELFFKYLFTCEPVEESTHDKVFADEMESFDASESEGESKHKLKYRCNYKGVYRSGNSGWQARGIVDGKQIHLASGSSKEACAQAAAQKVIELRSLGRAVHTDYGSLINQPVTCIDKNLFSSPNLGRFLVCSQ